MRSRLIKNMPAQISSSPKIPETASDLELLRRFEPVLRFIRGEYFYPSDIERYIQHCSLWMHLPDGHDEMLIRQGQVTLDILADPPPVPTGAVQFLRLVEPLDLGDSAKAMITHTRKTRDKENKFHAGQGRLARVGYISRLADAFFSLTLLMRGRVPGATAAVAELEYRDAQRADEKYVYHGRVIRHNGWVVLQYWFFYFYNGWRSAYHGVNDHEADWEMMMLYLYPCGDGMLTPRWAGYAAHDFHGDDLRRRWDDQDQLDVMDGHPVVYVGAGSHASYFRPGEYVTAVSVALLAPVTRLLDGLNKFWMETLKQAPIFGTGPFVFRIPFVDYARGDGVNIGPGQKYEWTPVVINESVPWVKNYRGLWGLYARDPIAGENAPSGPMYNRDGSVRSSWYDTLGFSGLDKVPTPPAELDLLDKRCVELEARQVALDQEILVKSEALHRLGVTAEALQDDAFVTKQVLAIEKNRDELSAGVRALRREQTENEVLLTSLKRRVERLRAGIEDDPQMHIKHLAEPASAAQLRFDRLAEAWSAVSIGLILAGIVSLILFNPKEVWTGLAALLFVFVLIESIFHGNFQQTVAAVSVLLAVMAMLLVIFMNWQLILVGGAIALAIYLIWQNVRELGR